MSSGILQSLYESSPPLVQHLGVSLYGLKVYWREYGPKFDRLLNEFEGHLKWSQAELVAYQEEQLQKLVSHCYTNVPFYSDLFRNLHLTPADIRNLSDLAKLPRLTRKMVMEKGAELIAQNVSKSDRIVGHTSGTTGSPLRLVWDRHVCLLKTVVDWRQKRLAGINPGDKIAFFLGRQVAPLGQSKPPFWRHNWVMNHLFCSSFHLSPGNMRFYFEKLAKFGPLALEGYPSTMSVLAGYLNQRNETFPLKAVFTSSETLQPSQRAAIEKAFACRVFDFYGMAERVVFATECEQHMGKHINSDFGLVEISDGKGGASPANTLGRIVATGLHNFSMPLIRYETSDVTSLETEPCRCGRSMPVMSGVTTKDEDIVVTPDGRYVSSSILNAVTHHLINVAESQIVQEERHRVVMRVVPRAAYTEADSEFIQTELQKVLGARVEVTVDIVESIERTANGKFRWVISKVPLEF
ncbi:MAG: phenylacetate--CoA ligase family protein [bacterium]|nr:phenylacetate--CoA ligase family protein [bacterium]